MLSMFCSDYLVRILKMTGQGILQLPASFFLKEKTLANVLNYI